MSIRSYINNSSYINDHYPTVGSTPTPLYAQPHSSGLTVPSYYPRIPATTPRMYADEPNRSFTAPPAMRPPRIAAGVTPGRNFSNPPSSVGRDIGNALGPVSGILGSAAGGAAALGEAAVIGGIAAAPALAVGAAAAGVGYGVYKLGESFHFW